MTKLGEGVRNYGTLPSTRFSNFELSIIIYFLLSICQMHLFIIMSYFRLLAWLRNGSPSPSQTVPLNIRPLSAHEGEE